MRKVIGCASLLLMSASISLMGQEEAQVQPERPTVATHAGTVAKGWVETEFGGEADRYDNGTNGSVVPIVVKIGVASNMQLSLLPSLQGPPGGDGIGLGDVAIGLKWRIADDLPILGRFAVFPSVKIPSGSTSKGTGTGTTDVGFMVISSNQLGPVAVDVNLAVTRRSGDGSVAPTSSTLWTVSTGGSIAGQWGWVLEAFGYPGTSGPAGALPTAALLMGPTLLVQPWLSFDAGVIVPVVGVPPRAIYVGAVWNFGRI